MCRLFFVFTEIRPACDINNNSLKICSCRLFLGCDVDSLLVLHFSVLFYFWWMWRFLYIQWPPVLSVMVVVCGCKCVKSAKCDQSAIFVIILLETQFQCFTSEGHGSTVAGQLACWPGTHGFHFASRQILKIKLPGLSGQPGLHKVYGYEGEWYDTDYITHRVDWSIKIWD